MKKTMSKQRYIINAISVFVVILIAWIAITELGLVKPVILPKPIDVAKYIYEAFRYNNLITDVGISVSRILLGFLLSAVVGVPLGMLAGTSKTFDSLLRPICEFMRYIPVPTLVPLVMVWVGIGENAKIAVLFLGCVFQLLLMVADDAAAVSDDLINAGATLGATRLQQLTKILLPAVMPRIMENLRMTIGWAWTYLTLAELFATESGLGYRILKAQRFMQTDAIFGLILTIGALGLITDRLFILFNRKVFHWAE
jgi:NitT/TauT family transport system permease protein